MAPVIKRSTWYVFGSCCLWWWDVFPVGFNCSLVTCLEYLPISPPCCPIQLTHYRQLLSSLPLRWALCGFHVCFLSQDNGIMSATHHIRYVVVCGMTSCVYRLSGVVIWLNFPRVSTFRLWIHLVLETSFYVGWLLFGTRLVSDTLSCDPMPLSESSSFLVTVLLLLGVS